jgi:hypothetical protein
MMKIRALILLFPMLSLACGLSGLPSLAPATITAAPTLPPPPTNTPSEPIAPTHTPTPTLIGALPSATLFLSPTPYGAIASYTPTGGPTLLVTDTPSILQGTGFDSIDVSTDEFHWGSCDPTTVTFTAQVTDPSKVFSVVVFTRFTNKSSGKSTGWDQGRGMDDQSGGKFTTTLDGTKAGVYYDAWVEYQLVATDTKAQNVARSPVFPSSLSLTACP